MKIRPILPLVFLLCLLFMLGACGGSADESLEGLPSITSLRQLDSAILMTWQVWPEDERGAYFAQFAFDPDSRSQQVYRWAIDIQRDGPCRTKWFDWSQSHDTVRFYCGQGIYLQPVAPKPGELLPAPEVPDRAEGWIRPFRNGSPDGQHLLYLAADEATGNERLMVIDTHSRQSLPIDLPADVEPLTTKWSPDGQSFVVLVQYEEAGELQWDVYQVYKDRWQTELLTGIRLNSLSRELSWSNDGQQLLYGQADATEGSLWVYEFATDTATAIFKFTNEENDVGVHAWSPDDLRIVFVSSFEAGCNTNDSGVVSCERKMHIIDRNGQELRDIPGMGEQDDLAWIEESSAEK